MERSKSEVLPNASPKRKKKTGRRKLKPLKKGSSFPVGQGEKLPVTELLEKTLVKSHSLPVQETTLLVPHSRLKVHLDTGSVATDLDSTLSPGRLISHRSWGSNSLDGTEYTCSTRLTQRERVREIAKRAEKNLEPPAFLTPLEELDPTMFTWNHKSSKKDSGLRSPKKDHSLKKPSINIIGCLQSTELILAQADQRMRHQQETMELRQRKCEEKVRQIDEAIQLKYTRAERYAAILEMKQRQATWLKIVKALNYLSIVSTEVKHHFKVGMFFSHTVHAALVIKRACKRFMRRHLVHKFNYKFMVLFRKREFVFRLATRIKRKEIAMNRIKTFLTEYRNHHRMNVVVHKYLTGVRKVQRNIRDFIACKHAKISVLGVLWARIERQYVRSMLDKRKLAKRSTGKMSAAGKDAAGVDYSELDHKSLVDMKNQAKLWDRIDSKMEDKIKSLKASGVILNDNEEDQVERYMLPARKRWQALMDMLQFLRKEFYQSQRAIIRRKMDAEAAFSETHAHDLLKGRTEDISRIVSEKFDKRLVTLKYKPFMLFSSINHKLIWDRIMAAHTINETWAIKLNDFSNYSTKCVQKKARAKTLTVPGAGAGAGAALGGGQSGSIEEGGEAEGEGE